MKDIAHIFEKIDKVKLKSGRRDPIDIIVVTKNRSFYEISKVLTQGIFHIGENRVQEADKKFCKLNEDFFEKHIIGPLQSNKENQALELFDTIQSIECLSQLSRLIHKINARKYRKKIFIQINTSLEESKHGL